MMNDLAFQDDEQRKNLLKAFRKDINGALPLQWNNEDKVASRMKALQWS